MTEGKAVALPTKPEEREASSVFVGIAPIVAKERYREFCRLTLRCPDIAQRALPGQFVNLYLDPLGGGKPFERQSLPMAAILPRPFSILKIVPMRKGNEPQTLNPQSPQAFSVLFNLRHIGTRWLADLTADAPVRVAGPLGKGFWVPKGTRLAVLVGGGIGATPFPFFAERLKAEGIEVVTLLGAQTVDKLPFDTVRAERPLMGNGRPLSHWAADDFESMGIRSAVSLDKPTEGFFEGNVVQLLKAWMTEQDDTSGIALYGCGPDGMLKALAQLAERYSLPCQVSTEEKMACGLGICFGCPIPMRTGGYKLCCTEGPVFEASEVAW